MKRAHSFGKRSGIVFILGILGLFFLNCNHEKNPEPQPPAPPNPPAATNEVDFWLTNSDESVKLQKQNTVLAFGNNSNQYPTIEVDSSISYQTIDGFGYTLTGGSAEVINSLTASVKNPLLQELFGSGENDISISYLRVSIGASDLNDAPFSYDDMPQGESDPNLDHFSLGPDTVNVIPLLQQILAINPNIKILGSPWSAPVWMKDNNSFVGGSLQPQFYETYAQYFVKYILAMKVHGIKIDAITPQNEPLNPANNPSMSMTAAQQADFIKNHLGPAFQKAGIDTKIIIYDHNCDRPDYPLSVLADADAKKFINGSAFHLYGGDISAMASVHTSYPEKDVYFTEQYTPANGSFSGDLQWHLKNVIIGSMRNWSKNALEWNLANNAYYGPHTQGGCDICKGAITVLSGSSFNRNVSYYIIAHVSKFVPPGSVRINTNIPDNIQNVAFKTPSGKKVLVVENDNTGKITFNIKFKGKWTTVSLNGGSVATFIW